MASFPLFLLIFMLCIKLLIYKSIVRLRADIPFATHRFRHAVGSHAPIDDPDHPGIASSLLAIGSRMHEKHYNRSRDHVAETNYHNALAREPPKAVSLARRLLAEREEGEN
jgi:hypothetical protein